VLTHLPLLHTLINLYVLETPHGPVLVDTGAPAMGPWIGRLLRRRGLVPQRLTAVVLTHFHIDHAGNAPYFRRLGVPIYAHRNEVPILRGRVPHPGYGTGPTGRLLYGLERALLPSITLANVHPLENGEHLFGSAWQVVDAPGHSPGTLALWHCEQRILLSADTLVTTCRIPRGPVPLFTADLPRARASAELLLDLGPKQIYPGHGPPVTAGAFTRVRARLQTTSDPCRAAGDSTSST